ncbi:MAG: hypothetical protein WC196_06330 [Bacilli bacterium]|jgi:hypothetical protein
MGMGDYKYLIVYNGETDFIGAYSKGQVEEEVEILLKDGYGQDDIDIYEVKNKDFNIVKAEISLNED